MTATITITNESSPPHHHYHNQPQTNPTCLITITILSHMHYQSHLNPKHPQQNQHILHAYFTLSL